MRFLIGIMIVIGLALSGCDGPYFPCPNMIGVGILCVVAALVPGTSHQAVTRHAQAAVRMVKEGGAS
jgi:hypothetical protein